MNFNLEKIQPTNQPVVYQLSPTEKKRLNRVAECPKCGKMMIKKSLRYSHNCDKTIDATTPIEPLKPENIEVQMPEVQSEPQQPPEPKKIIDDDISEYLQRLNETRIQKRKEKISNLYSRAV